MSRRGRVVERDKTVIVSTETTLQKWYGHCDVVYRKRFQRLKQCRYCAVSGGSDVTCGARACFPGTPT